MEQAVPKLFADVSFVCGALNLLYKNYPSRVFAQQLVAVCMTIGVGLLDGDVVRRDVLVRGVHDTHGHSTALRVVMPSLDYRSHRRGSPHGDC